MVKRLKLTVLVEDSMDGAGRELIVKHGLSFLIETEVGGNKLSILMDTGPPQDVMLHNADLMGIDLSKVDVIF